MRWHGVAGILLLIISEVLLFLQVEPISTWFYSLAWWSYILVLDAINHRLTGDSYLTTRRKEFFWLIPISTFFWLIFELFNLRLQNWYYVNIPDQRWIRWPGYFLAYGTVLPGIFQTAELFRNVGWLERWSAGPARIRVTARLLAELPVIGMILLALPMIYPQYYFPLVWLGFIFLLEPLNYRWGESSLLRQFQGGDYRTLFGLLLAGLVCGGLWEFWNYWATSKWIYTVPAFSWLKLFEMPLLGFLGFPPFAVECYVMYHALRGVRSRAGSVRAVRYASIALLVAFYALAFFLIDEHTVRSFASFPLSI